MQPQIELIIRVVDHDKPLQLFGNSLLEFKLRSNQTGVYRLRSRLMDVGHFRNQLEQAVPNRVYNCLELIDGEIANDGWVNKGLAGWCERVGVSPEQITRKLLNDAAAWPTGPELSSMNSAGVAQQGVEK